MIYITDALVIREAPYGDHDKLLTLLTAEHGRVRVMAKGARRIGSKFMTASQLFAWGNYAIRTRGDFYWLSEATLIESFYGLHADLNRLSLASYLCDVTYEATGENAPADDVLPIILNTFYALANGRAPDALIKGAFELRIAAVSGYCPDLEACSCCGKPDAEGMYLDVMNGCLICAECMQTAAQRAAVSHVEYDLPPTVIFLPLPPAALEGMRYVLRAPTKRLFSFRIEDKTEMADFSRACESYLLNHFERGFQSLDFYHAILHPKR
ncbi:MAG: DNA repair protein RecO [Clostridia bacterium]|nr:DNA repair protein RecO [Clostridia bacterium]